MIVPGNNTLVGWRSRTTFVLGLAVAVSFSPREASARFGYRNLFGFLDALTAGLLLPVVALFTALFVGWRLRPEILRLELSRESGLFFSLWRFLLRFPGFKD